jgi:hypothetical protein
MIKYVTFFRNYIKKLESLAYFPEMKVGLSNHQSVCLYPPPLH